MIVFYQVVHDVHAPLGIGFLPGTFDVVGRDPIRVLGAGEITSLRSMGDRTSRVRAILTSLGCT